MITKMKNSAVIRKCLLKSNILNKYYRDSCNIHHSDYTIGNPNFEFDNR